MNNTSCELLQNVYLCSSKHNNFGFTYYPGCVVNCFKMCIFAVASTIRPDRGYNCNRCELLQNVYLCSSKHNPPLPVYYFKFVVNCFKMCIFAVASTMVYTIVQ